MSLCHGDGSECSVWLLRLYRLLLKLGNEALVFRDEFRGVTGERFIPGAFGRRQLIHPVAASRISGSKCKGISALIVIPRHANSTAIYRPEIRLLRLISQAALNVSGRSGIMCGAAQMQPRA